MPSDPVRHVAAITASHDPQIAVIDIGLLFHEFENALDVEPIRAAPVSFNGRTVITTITFAAARIAVDNNVSGCCQ